MNPSEKNRSNHLKTLLSGGIAGCIARIITAPMERVAILIQTNNAQYCQYSLPNIFREVYKREGLQSFWKGNGTNLIRVFPFSAIELSSFEIYKSLFQSLGNKELNYFLAGAASGMTASTAVYPLDLLRTIYAYQTDQKKFKGILSSWKQIVQENGGLKLYRGLGATLLGIVPYTSLKLGVFQNLQIVASDFSFFSKDTFSFINGAVAGCVAISLTYPTDLIRKRVQIQVFSDAEKKMGYMDTVRSILRSEGLKGLYKGLGAVYLKFIPLTAITLSVNERLKKTLTQVH